MKVISLFDGISCARVALERVKLPVETYIACEVDKYATQISNKNYQDIIRGGDVRGMGAQWLVDNAYDLYKVDLLIGGSPCQDLSIAKKDRKGLDGERSGLFWEYARILREVKPKYFILENVASMHGQDKNVITRELGVAPVLLDAKDFGACERPRLFWTNIPVQLPSKNKAVLKDIINWGDIHKKIHVENPVPTKRGIKWDKSGKGYFSQQDRAYSVLGKHPTLPKSRLITKVNVLAENGEVFVLNWDEIEKLQGLPVGYTDLGKDNRIEACGGVIGNAFNVDVVAHILSFIPNA